VANNNHGDADMFVHLREDKRRCPTHKLTRLFYETDSAKRLALYCIKCEPSNTSNLKVLPQIIYELNTNRRKYQAHRKKCEVIIDKVRENIPEFMYL
jgi:hypothetical protein